MTLVDRTLWLIESNLTKPLTLERLSGLSAASPYHLVRSFGSATGLSPMAYLRARRLSVAARRIAHGSEDILSIAFDAQYASHEAFTRAFAALFGTLPSTVRAARSTEMLTLQEPIKMDKSRLVDVPAPELKARPAFEVIGLGTAFTIEDTSPIPPLWQDFNARKDEIASDGPLAYGVCLPSDQGGGYRYLAGMQATRGAELPSGMERVRIPEGRYAVFTHRGHISGIGNTNYSIWNRALLDLGLEPREDPDFEVYDSRFNPKTGHGEVEIWIPISG